MLGRGSLNGYYWWNISRASFFIDNAERGGDTLGCGLEPTGILRCQFKLILFRVHNNLSTIPATQVSCTGL